MSSNKMLNESTQTHNKDIRQNQIYGVKDKHQITRWYKDQSQIGQINLNVEHDDQVEKEDCATSFNIIIRYFNTIFSRKEYDHFWIWIFKSYNKNKSKKNAK